MLVEDAVPAVLPTKVCTAAGFNPARTSAAFITCCVWDGLLQFITAVTVLISALLSIDMVAGAK